MTDLTGLIERVRAATGADRGLDARIAIAVDGWTKTPLDWTDRYGKKRNASLSYTASIDAAIALAERVLPGSAVGLDPVFFEGDGHPRIEYDAIVCIPRWERWNPVNSNWIERHEARHKDRVLAIILATLLALPTGAK